MYDWLKLSVKPICLRSVQELLRSISKESNSSIAKPIYVYYVSDSGTKAEPIVKQHH